MTSFRAETVFVRSVEIETQVDALPTVVPNRADREGKTNSDESSVTLVAAVIGRFEGEMLSKDALSIENC